MIKTRKFTAVITMMMAGLLVMAISGCQKDEIPPRETSYVLKVQDVLGVTGTATFVESDNNVTINLVLLGVTPGSHPAQLCMNTFAENGGLVVNLNPVDGSGKSSSLISSMTYNQLVDFDGYIKVMKSDSEPTVILAQGDIGGNVLTETNISYKLDTIQPYGVAGTALFEKRKNGNTLVTISLTGTIAGEEYPATINLSSVATIGGGPITKTLTSVNGTTGKSYTTIRRLDGGLVINYDNWLVYNGYINIYQSLAQFDKIISQGNIGSNID